MHLPIGSISILFTISLFILFLCISLYLYKTLIKNQFEKNNLLKKLIYCQTILKGFPDSWCCWSEGDIYVNISPSFRSLFKLDANQNLRVQDFISLLGDSSTSPFQRSLTHIKDFGGSFTLELSIFDNTKHIRIDGCQTTYDSFIDNTQKSTSNIPKIMFIMNIKDISQECNKSQKLLLKQNKLEEQNHIFKVLLDVAPVALWYRNADGRIHACNQSYAGVLDTTIHRAIAENRELLYRFGEVSTYDLSRMAKQRQEKTTIRSHMVIGGQRKYLEIAEIPLLNTGESCGYAIDITAIEDLEKELKLVIQAQKDVLNNLSSPVAIYGPDTRMIFFNTAYVTMFQQDESWLLTQPSLPEIMDQLRQYRKMPEYTDFRAHKESRLKLFKNLMEPINEIMHQPDGVICRLVIAPMPNGGLVYIFDNITDNLLLERRYNTLTAVQKETIDHLYEGIIVFGTDYRLRLSNPAMSKIWDMKENQYTEGTHINEILLEITPQFKTPKASKAWRSKMLDIISRRHPEKQKIKLKKDKVLECTYVPLPDGSHLLSFIDVSDTWRFEKALQERNQILEHHDRLKSDFIAHVSYELQSPLNTITGFVDILNNQYFGPLNEKQMDYSKGIEEAAARLSNLMSDLLDLASIQAGTLNLHFQETNIDSLLSSLIMLVKNRANDHGLELLIENNTQNVTINWDIKRVRHALFNLLSNAIKFTPSGGSIIITTILNQNKNDIDIIIEDTGVGIKEPLLTRIQHFFEHSSSDSLQDHNEITKRKRKDKISDQDIKDVLPQMDTISTDIDEDHTIGLGLTLVHRLVELHGGKMYITSVYNEGTKIRCTLPLNPMQ